MAPAAGSSREKVVVTNDGLSLPQPPITLDFAIRGDATSEGFLQRYVRKGTSKDATLAVVGKGGFGTAYRFVRDTSFTPPSSLQETNRSSDYHQTTNNTHDYTSRMSGDKSQYQAEGSPLQEIEDVQKTPNSHHQFDPYKTSRSSKMAPSPSVNFDPRGKAPAVIVVKVCRTPTSGSYDELPKTGKGREEAKVAAQELTEGNPLGHHTRIVRGEARLLRYLQLAQALEKKRGAQQSLVVRLLADIAMPMKDDQDEEGEGGRGGPPIPRLLIFERLVDLDAELTPRGWAKSKRLWTVEKVESISRDVIAGLKFLHEHHVVHGDLKPSNFMRCPKTGHVKLIDLGASRRWVRLHNCDKERTSAVEELDQAVKSGYVDMAKPGQILCEGLGSLTGSPHFMAPEVLLQAGRYLSEDGLARSILDDHMNDDSLLPNVPSARLLEAAYRDFKRGWGIKADVWSWACSTMSLLLRTMPSDERPSSNSICAFDFCFDNTEDALAPRWRLHNSNDNLPRFHQWARVYPLRIMSVLHNGVELPEIASIFRTPMKRMLQATFQQQDNRPSASVILSVLDSTMNHRSEAEILAASCNSSLSNTSMVAHSVDLHLNARSSASLTTSGFSHAEEPINVDLSTSHALSSANISMGQDRAAIQFPPSPQSNIVMLESPPPKRRETSTSINGNVPPTSVLSPQQKFLRNRLIHSPVASPNLYTTNLPTSSSPLHRMTSPSHMYNQPIDMELSPGISSIALPTPAHHHHPVSASSSSSQTGGAFSGTSTVHRRTTRSSALLDEVFMQAYEQEEEQMSPVPPMPPTAKVRQMDSIPMIVEPTSPIVRVRSTKDRQKPLPPSPDMDQMESPRLKPRLSFHNLRPRRESIVSRLASHFSPRRAQNTSAVAAAAATSSSALIDEFEPHSSKDGMQIDEAIEEKEVEIRAAPMRTLYSSDPFGPPNNQSSSSIDRMRTSTPPSEVCLDQESVSSPLSNLQDLTAKNRGASTISRTEGNQLRGRKSSNSLFGMDLNKTLRSVRSFNSASRVFTHGHQGIQSPGGIRDGDDSCFLQHDPYASDVNFSCSDFSSSLRQYPPSQSSTNQYQTRGRSWSSIFKRKKV